MGSREDEIRERLAPFLAPIPPEADATWLYRRADARHAVHVCAIGDLRYLLDRVAELRDRVAELERAREIVTSPRVVAELRKRAAKCEAEVDSPTLPHEAFPHERLMGLAKAAAYLFAADLVERGAT